MTKFCNALCQYFYNFLLLSYPKLDIELKVFFFMIVGMAKDDHVSIHVDLEGKCRKGSKVQLEGEKYFVGNGIAVLSRSEIFQEKQPRYIFMLQSKFSIFYLMAAYTCCP